MTANPSSELVAGFFRGIYDDWSKPSGPCKGCLLRSRDVEPGCGGGNWDSRIAVVAISPNETGERRKRFDADVPDLRRYASPTYKEFEETRRGKGYWMSRGEGFLYDRELTKVLRSFDMDLRDIYYTNCQKCANEISNPARDRQGRARCLTHLQSELEAMAPKLIVAFGREPWDAVQEIMDVSLDYGDFPTETKLMPDCRTYLVGLYHWSNWGRNRRWIPTEKRYAQWVSTQLGEAMKIAGI